MSTPTINSIAYSPQIGWVAAGGTGGSLEIYDSDLNKIRSLTGHDGTVLVLFPSILKG
jgi:hypothetical protein